MSSQRLETFTRQKPHVSAHCWHRNVLVWHTGRGGGKGGHCLQVPADIVGHRHDANRMHHTHSPGRETDEDTYQQSG